MTLGKAPRHEDLFRSGREFVEARLSGASIYRLLAKEGDRLFGDERFADVFLGVGRR